LRAGLVGLLAVLLLLWGPSARARPLDEVIAAGSLRVVAYLDNAPFSWDDDGTPRGIDVDLARAIARELGVAAEIVLRMQGEKADDDLRVNVWKGPLTGGGVGDIMMHVPIDREFALRNREAVLGNAYFQERVALAIHPELTGEQPTFDAFRTRKIGVQLGTVGDYFLMTYDKGALIPNVAHHVKPAAGAREFAAKRTSALLGVRSQIEALLHEQGIKPVIVEPAMPGIVRSQWLVGMAWKENSRDLGYAIAAAMERLQASGAIAGIFADFGVTYVPPPAP
jgi:ABC-type amino acid transport substrate-binding protein